MDGSHLPRRTLRTASDLASEGLARDGVEQVAARYAVAITPAMQELLHVDPIARQFVPDAAELTLTADENTDPIGDQAHSPVKGIVHRYPDRVLLKPTHTCAVYCRFCFRREMVGPGSESLDANELAAAIDYIRSRPEIWEVILTGGDPLILSPRRLSEIVAALSEIPHLGVIRLHTRIPVADPARISDELVAALASDKAIYVVLHANHPGELSEAAIAACRRIIDAGIPMLSQSVLLRGVNDDAATLEQLFRTLVRHRIKPYYLHHADKAPGTSHFRTTLAEGQALMRQMRGRVSGLCQPEYVLDIPGGHGKVPVGRSYLDGDIVEDWRGQRHAYAQEAATKAL
ncbi:MAG: lysine-2,3-aminomutase-like protein [Alphaproteobacteria bacterium]|nr:lysine-2,3-aminomutase-like protein [Alphaproteobacteria bacterium]